jgi:hypothetical protein
MTVMALFFASVVTERDSEADTEENTDTIDEIDLQAEKELLDGYNLITLEQVTPTKIILDRENFTLCVVQMIASFATTFFQGYFSLYITEEFNVTSAMIGFMYSMFAFVYVLSCIVSPMVLAGVPNKI